MKPTQPPPGQSPSAPPPGAVPPAPALPAAAPGIAPARAPARAPASVAPAPVQTRTARPPGDEPLAIEPIGAVNNDASFGVEWRPVQLGAQRTLGCVVSAPAGHSLSVVIEQGAYRKTLSGTDSVALNAIPVAGSGTEGTLTVRDDTGTAVAQFSWLWQPPGSRKRPQVRELPQQRAPAQLARTTQTAKQAAKSASPAGIAATTFFGQAAHGSRFAFILDMSGSMEGARWAACQRELTGALQALSGQAEFFVVLFSDHLQEPPGQLDWTMAHPDVITAVIAWMQAVTPGGGTLPAPAFQRVFALAARPDALYFMTDGEFNDCTAADIARLNGSGTSSKLGALARGLGRTLFGKSDPPATVINTIALDDASAASTLRQIAQDAGGEYAHVSSR
jgi:hypothetical protein